MAKPKNPLLSFEAHGTIANAITFQRSGRKAIARARPVPKDPYTLPQAYQRWDYRDYAYLWTLLTNNEKQVYRANASRYHMTGFALWMRTHLNALTDLSGRWHLDEKAGATAYDSSKNANNGIIFGASPTSGLIDGAYFFDGINDEIDCGNDPTLQLTDNFTWLAFTKAGLINANIDIITKWVRNPQRQGISLYRTPTNFYVFALYNAGFSDSILSDIAYPDTNWHHIAGRRKDGTAHLFLDGIKQAASTAFIPADSGDSFIIGKLYSDLIPYNQTNLDMVEILNRPLDDTEILRHSKRRYPA